MAKVTEAPKFNIVVMLVLGIIIGMLAYFLVFYSRANVFGGPDVYPAWTSYGSGNVHGVLASEDLTVQGEDVVSKVVWYVKDSSSIKFHSYVINIGSGSSASSTKVRFCLNVADACGQTTTYDEDAQVGRIGSDVLVGTLGAGKRSNVRSSSRSVTPRLGKHVYTACLITTGEQTDSLPNNCTSYGFEVVPSGSIAGVTFLSRPLCSTTTDCHNGDYYGTTSFVEPGSCIGCQISRIPGWFIGEAYAANACGDGGDNDNDGLIDYGSGSSNDPGCKSSSDNKEENQNRPLCPGNSEPNCDV